MSAPAPTTASASSSLSKHIVLKIWRANGIICDNAAQIDYLLRTGWTIACTENLSTDDADGSAQVLYVLKNTSPTYVAPPTPPASYFQQTGLLGATTFSLACSISRGRLLIQALDDPQAQPIQLGAVLSGTYPSPTTGFVTFPFTLGNTQASPRLIGVFCINDSAPPDGRSPDNTQIIVEAPFAHFHVELSYPGQAPTVLISADPIPSGTTSAYYFRITPS
jgi:hypothetical protein